jgi:hypothetical protein
MAFGILAVIGGLPLAWHLVSAQLRIRRGG